MDLKQVLERRKQQLHSHSTVNKNNNINYSTVNNKVINYSTVDYTYVEAKTLVESLDNRLYRNSQYLSFYIKATRKLGWSRILELQAMLLNDPRIDRPDKLNPEKVFCSLLRDELAGKEMSNK